MMFSPAINGWAIFKAMALRLPHSAAGESPAAQ
jgi:hypothetical protein